MDYEFFENQSLKRTSTVNSLSEQIFPKKSCMTISESCNRSNSNNEDSSDSDWQLRSDSNSNSKI